MWLWYHADTSEPQHCDNWAQAAGDVQEQEHAKYCGDLLLGWPSGCPLSELRIEVATYIVFPSPPEAGPLFHFPQYIRFCSSRVLCLAVQAFKF